MSRWVGVDGWEVGVITLDGRQLFRVRHLGYLVSYCTTVAVVARHIDLADLVEVVDLPRSP
ncbi:transposase [Sphaerimonospora cavernae]|uniref:Transposase n=1 Tax=Sphaerimonospora cavernae TaxID=1740611 RepID=A0ABV6U5M3_9ACTN